MYAGLESALGLPALYAGAKILAENAASLPIRIYMQGDERDMRYTGPSVFDKPSTEGTIFDWVHTCIASLVLHGNAWGLITGRDKYGYPTGIEWQDPAYVWVESDKDQPFNPQRSKIFLYGRRVERDKLFHVKAFSIPGRVEGISLIRQFGETILAGKRAADYGLTWFEAGGFPTGILQNCVDTETEILTRDGWKHYDELTIGEEALTLNAETGLAEWGQVQRVYVNEGPNPVVRMENKSHSSVSTPNHRWPVMAADGSYRWTNTAEMSWNDRICAAAPVVGPSEAKWSDAMAELAGWFFTEGSIDKRSGGVVIGQSREHNPQKVSRIRAALEGVFGPAREHCRDNRKTPGWRESEDEDVYKGETYRMTRFHLNSVAGKILQAIAPDRVLSTRFLSELTQGQLLLLIEAALGGDGSIAGKSDYYAGSPDIAQTDRRRVDAFQVACALAGKSGSVRPRRGGYEFGMTVQRRNARKPKGHKEYVTEEVIEGKVWCPVTPNKSWFARRNGTCYFTGNTEIEVDSEQSTEMREYLMGVLRRHQPLVLGRDWDFKAVTVPPNEAQFIQAIQLNATQIAALLNLPPDRVGGVRGDSLTYNTQEQSSLQIIDALRPWLVRLESAFFDLLPRRRFVRFDTDALLKTDLKTRTDIYQIWRDIGLVTVDEIRQEMGREPLPGGIGSETMPLVLMNAMATRAGGIPKSIMPHVDLEMDIATDRLKKLEKTMVPYQGPPQGIGPGGAEGQNGISTNPSGAQPVNGKVPIGKPNVPPPLTQDPASFLASLISVQRDGGEAGYEAAVYLQKIEERISNLEHDTVTLQSEVEVQKFRDVQGDIPVITGARLGSIEAQLRRLDDRKEVPVEPEQLEAVLVRQSLDTPSPTNININVGERGLDNVPGLAKDSGMVYLKVPDGKLPRPEGGPKNHHITLAYLGEHVSDEDFAKAKKATREAAKSTPQVRADIGGQASFPPSDPAGGKRVDYAPVDLDEHGYALRHKLAGLSKSEHLTWKPHVTLKYSDPEDAPLSPVDTRHVIFTHVHVKRGNQVSSYPLNQVGSEDPGMQAEE
jgi:phage portal protein BeeE/2'-5' RNA ligase